MTYFINWELLTEGGGYVDAGTLRRYFHIFWQGGRPYQTEAHSRGGVSELGFKQQMPGPGPLSGRQHSPMGGARLHLDIVWPHLNAIFFIFVWVLIISYQKPFKK